MLPLFYASLLLAGQALPPTTFPKTSAMVMHARVAALSGQVMTEAGAPLPGVTIVVQGSPAVSSTNSDGRFLVPLPAADPVLVFTCAGYRAQTVVPPAEGSLTVTMYALTGSGADASTLATGGGVSASGAARAAALPFAEVMPAFTGGEEAYKAYLRDNAHFPAAAQAQNLRGEVYVGFVVDEQGRITDAEVVKGCGHGFDEEALRLIRLMPWWQPGLDDGKPVRVARTLRIIFRVQK